MTETAPIGTLSYVRRDQQSDSIEQQHAHRLRQGIPVPFVEIRAMRDDEIVPWDGKTMGELEVRGPWVASAYYERPDSVDRFSSDGWLRTGDIVSIDSRDA